MQQYGNDQILYSPSDLVTFLGCPHVSFLDVKALSDDMDKAEAEAEASTTGQFLQRSYSAQNCAKFLTSGSYSQNVHTLHFATPLAELFLLYYTVL